MASRNEFEAAQLTTGQRLEVLAMYRRERLGAKPGGNFPVDALTRTRDTYARWCALEVLDGNTEWATIRARQSAYAWTLCWRGVVRRVHRVILSRRAANA